MALNLSADLNLLAGNSGFVTLNLLVDLNLLAGRAFNPESTVFVTCRMEIDHSAGWQQTQGLDSGSLMPIQKFYLLHHLTSSILVLFTMVIVLNLSFLKLLLLLE